MDYRFEKRIKVGVLRGDINATRLALTPPFRKHGSSTKKKKPIILEMHLNTPLSSRGLKLSNSKPGCRVSGIHFFVK
jgi:hypothetical protein